MFDLSKIELIQGDARERNKLRRNYSFVGIKRNEQTGQMEFWLPLGFADFPKDFGKVKQFFFRMYRTLRKYLSEKELEAELLDNKRDGIYEKDGGFRFKNEFTDDIVLYSKLNAFDKILNGFDELRIASLENKIKRTPIIDYTQIHKYLHKAIYLEDDVIYIDEMDLPKGVIIPESTPIVKLFCYIYTEIKTELEDLGEVPILAKDLAEEFKIEYLPTTSGLFTEEGFDDTISILRAQLDEIDRLTTYKDEDYWHFFEAVESFLYANNDFNQSDDKYWGVTNFSLIWERMCQEYVLNNMCEQLLFYEYDGRLEIESSKQGFKIEPFKLTMNKVERYRYLRPDAVFIEDINRMSANQVFYTLLNPKRRIAGRYSYYHVDESNDLKRFFPDVLEVVNKYLKKNPMHRKEPNNDIFRNIREIDIDEFKDEIESTVNGIPTDILFTLKPLVLHLVVQIVDFKYMSRFDYQSYSEEYLDFNGENKIKADIQKQLVYEWAWQNNFPVSKTINEFWIPGYNQGQGFKTLVKVTNQAFNKSQIKLFTVDFEAVQKAYLNIYDQA